MMDSTERTQLQADLSDRLDAITAKWFEAIAHICNTEHTPVETRRHLAELTGQIITLLCTEPFDHHGSRLIGTALAHLSIEPQVLDLTQGVLTSQIVAGLFADQVVALQPRLAALFGGLGTGFSRQARQRILAEQEQIRGALMSELRHRGEALRRARDELEQRVQARTAELIETNAQLRQEMAERAQVEDELRKHRDHLEELIQERTAELSAAKELAEAANRAKSIFLAQMSHELRTPLNAVLGYAQILKRWPLDANFIDGLNIIQRSGEHLLTLVTDILDIARIETDRLELRPVSVHIPSFLGTIAGIIRARAAAKGLAFSFDLPPEGRLPGGVRADGTRLRQVLLNLLDNAVKFTDEGQVILRVKCEDVKRKHAAITYRVSRITFEVQDTGPGIPSDRLEQIFQPFEQAEDMRGFTGRAGLGLLISRQLVRLMGGDLHVQSPVRPLDAPPSDGEMKGGPGSLFWFELTLPVTMEALEPAQLPDRVITGYRGPRRTLLVVDDVPSNRRVVVELLEPLGFEVVEAADGQHAVDVAQKIHPDLILMDHWMPGLNGPEAVRQMRQIPELADVPIIEVFSGSVSKKNRAQGREVGIDTFLPKPVSWPRLATLLQECLALEWEYEKTIEVREKEGKAILVPPPKEEMVILLDLARRGNMRAIRKRTTHIETLGEQYVPFARRLRELAERFEERQIRALIERCMEEDQ